MIQQPKVAEGEQYHLVMVRASAASDQTPRNHIPSTRICFLLLRSLPSKLSSFGVESPPLRRREDSKKEDGYALHATWGTPTALPEAGAYHFMQQLKRLTASSEEVTVWRMWGSLTETTFDFSSTVPWPGAVALSSSTFGRIQKAESMTWPWWQRFLWHEWWGCKILAWQVAPCQKRESFMLKIRPKVDGTAPRMATKSCLNSDRLASGNSSELSCITSLFLHQWLM